MIIRHVFVRNNCIMDRQPITLKLDFHKTKVSETSALIKVHVITTFF